MYYKIRMYAKLNENSNSICQPTSLKIDLLEHQKSAVYAMLEIEKNGFIDMKNFLYYDNKEKDLRIDTRIGVLGDKVGSGKSLMIVTLLLLSTETQKRPIYYSSDKYVNVKCLSDDYQFNKCNLLLIPQHLLSQWVDFFKLAPSIKVQILKKKNKIDKDTTVCIIIETLLNEFMNEYEQIVWNRIIIDEADTIKIKEHDLLANFIWLVTGTPSGISSSGKKYIKTIFGKNINWIPDAVMVKNDNKYIEKSIDIPVAKRIVINCFTPPELKIMEQFIPKGVVQMLNAGDHEGAIKTLNCHVDTEDNIFKVVIKTIENTIFNKSQEIELEKKKKLVGFSLENSKIKIQKFEKSIKNLTSRLSAIKNKIKESSDAICPICIGEIDNKTMVDCCGTMFCFDCLITTSHGNKCPFCQQKIGKNFIHVVGTTNDKKKKVQIKDKLDALIDIVQSGKQKKILVFANYQTTFEKIKIKLEEENINYDILKGNESTVNKILDKFKNGKIKVLMLNASHFGAGLNLQCTTDVVIYHRFTKEMEEQIIGRAQRYGRKTSLNIYYLIHDNEQACFNENFTIDEIDYEKFLEDEI